MDILTLNSHRLNETGDEKTLVQFVEIVKKEKPEIIELQKANQSTEAAIHPSVMLRGYTRCRGNQVVLRMDNHAAKVAEALFKNGLSYYWTWVPVNSEEESFNEGVAFFSSKPILETMPILANRIQEYNEVLSHKIRPHKDI